MLAHDLIVWTQALVLDGELAKAEPKRLRYRLLHVAGRLAFSAPARQAPPSAHLAVGSPAARRVPETQNAQARGPVTQPADDPTAAQQTAGHRPRARLPATPARPPSAALEPPQTATTTRKTRQITTPDHQPQVAEYLSSAYCTSRVKDLGIDHVDLLKIDVEGAEFDVLSAFKELPARVSAVTGEFHNQFPETRALEDEYFGLVRTFSVSRRREGMDDVFCCDKGQR